MLCGAIALDEVPVVGDAEARAIRHREGAVPAYVLLKEGISVSGPAHLGRIEAGARRASGGRRADPGSSRGLDVGQGDGALGSRPTQPGDGETEGGRRRRAAGELRTRTRPLASRSGISTGGCSGGGGTCGGASGGCPGGGRSSCGGASGGGAGSGSWAAP